MSIEKAQQPSADEGSSSNNDNNDNALSRTRSDLMNEDWDKSFSFSTPQANGDVALPNEGAGNGGGRNRRSLSDLMRLHAEHGKDLQLSVDEERMLSEELGLWINSDSSPYEGDDNPNASKL